MENRRDAIDKILQAYMPFYNIHKVENDTPVTFRCDYFAENEGHFISKKAKLWTAAQEQFIYFADIEKMDMDVFNSVNNYVLSDGMDRLNIGPGHMSSEIVSVFICSECSDEIYNKVKKSTVRKNFRFTLHGWMDFFPVGVSIKDRKVISSGAGKDMVRSISRILMF